MPYKSQKQARFFEGCRHSPQHMEGKCPDQATITEFHNATYHSGEGSSSVRDKLISTAKSRKSRRPTA